MAVAITEPPFTRSPSLQPLWHPTAPPLVTEKSADDPLGSWVAWQEHLARRKRPTTPPSIAGKRPPLLWGWPDKWQRDALQATLQLPSALAETILNDDSAAELDLPRALQTVGIAYALPELAANLPPEMWWRLAEQLHEVANEAQQHRVDWPADPRDVVRQQLLAGELPLALGYLFPEVRALRALRVSARESLSEALIELTDGQGLPHARLLPVLGPLFACWTRARSIGASLKRGPWSRKAESQYQWLVRHAIRLADADERFLLTTREETSPAWNNDLFSTALELVGDSSDYAAAVAALPRRAVPKDLKPHKSDQPDPSLNSDWSGIAVMANGWSQTDVRFAVSYADEPLTIELSVGGESLLAGPWTCETICDGEPVRAAGEWERLAWESGKRYDYLELGLTLSNGLRLERQLLFGRKDRVLYLADIVAANDREPRRFKHSLHLPLDVKVTWHPESETRDGVLLADKLRAAVLPLALAEWRADPRGGSLVAENGRLTLTQETHGRALCCPLLIDLDRKRSRKERTWRQLTVAEWMEILPRDTAVGFRAQSGNRQWLFYRSLGPVGNRTLLGQNLAGEFSAGPFHESGKYKEWIEIEAV